MVTGGAVGGMMQVFHEVEEYTSRNKQLSGVCLDPLYRCLGRHVTSEDKGERKRKRLSREASA